MIDIDDKLSAVSLCFFNAGRRYILCQKIGFFDPFETPSDVQQQIKTILVLPIIGLTHIAQNIIRLIKDILILAVSIPCISPALFIDGLVDSVDALASIIAFAVNTCARTLISLVSIVTRTYATVIYNLAITGEENNQDFIPGITY